MTTNTYQARNLLLRNLGFPTYLDYLQSELWAEIRQRVFALCGSKCRLCSEPARHIHHLGYGREVLLGKSLTQLVPLCEKCHKAVEFKRNGRKRTLVEAHSAYVRLWKRVKQGAKKLPLEERKKFWGYCQFCGRKAISGARCCRPCLKRTRATR